MNKTMDNASREHEQFIQFNIEEIKAIRDETNWRGRLAYGSSVVFISVFSFGIGQIFSSENDFINQWRTDQELRNTTSMAIIIILSSWVGVLTANNLIVSRLEIHLLNLMKVVYNRTGELFFYNLAFLYGNPMSKTIIGNWLAKFAVGSIGLFQYFLPNFVALVAWIYVVASGGGAGHYVLFSITSLFLFTSIGSSVFHFRYKVKIVRKSEDFYKQVVVNYYKTNGIP